ncbi:MAG: hypothetical protein IJZ26_01705 [Clostridia bacterium]|nr:hypothetical protein [Clostridia bacterium]
MIIKTFKFSGKKVFSMLLIIFIILIPIFVIPVIKNMPNNLGYLPNGETSNFLELWNVDTFEGGSASRSVFLEKVAIDFENQNRGVYIVIKNLTKAQAEEQLKQGVEPDLVSFGVGAGDLFKPYLIDLNVTYNVKSTVADGGKSDGKQLVLPWCLGGYVLCSKEGINQQSLNVTDNNVLGYGEETTVPLKALNNDSYDKNILYEKCLDKYTQYQAYQDFLQDKFKILLGTQRDFYRLQNRISTGALDCNFQFLGNYTDLIQWIGVFNKETELTTTKAFIEYLLSETQQKKLYKLGMFSATNVTVYEDNKYSEYFEFERVIKDVSKVGNAFLTDIEIKQEQQNVFAKLFS